MTELLAGPDLLNSLVGVLQKFRQNPIAVTADIKGFFHQIFVDENDSAVFRFFWFEDETMKTWAEHEMIVHTFGAKPSPCISTFTQNTMVRKWRDKFQKYLGPS
jgi:hypothetical protein